MNILCALADSNDSIAWWRGWAPYVALSKQFSGINVSVFDYDRTRFGPWDILEACDVYATSRLFLANHLSHYRMAMSCGKPTIIDFDDNYWQIPEWNGAYPLFDETARGILNKAANSARVITTSTQALGEYIISRVALDANVYVIPNALPDWYKWPTTKREKIVLYRGGLRTHSGDLFSVHKELQEVMNEYPDWKFVFCGGHPVMVSGKNMHWEPIRMVFDFHRWIQLLSPSIMINPLEFSLFNACKSNIAWMEGTYAGAAVLCPNLPQYQEPGCTTYKDGEFGEALRTMLNRSDQERAELVKRSQDLIDFKYRMSIVNTARHELLQGLVNAR